MAPSNKHYPAELNARELRMPTETRGRDETERAAMQRAAEPLELTSTETVRQQARQAEVDAGERPGTTSEESAEPKPLRRENAERKRANAILKAASASFAAELDRPSH